MIVYILFTSAGVIHACGGEPAFSAHGMALQLEPLVGSGAFYLFTIGFFFAALSSLVVNALIGATLFVDGKAAIRRWTNDPLRSGPASRCCSV